MVLRPVAESLQDTRAPRRRLVLGETTEEEPADTRRNHRSFVKPKERAAAFHATGRARTIQQQRAFGVVSVGDL